MEVKEFWEQYLPASRMGLRRMGGTPDPASGRMAEVWP